MQRPVPPSCETRTSVTRSSYQPSAISDQLEAGSEKQRQEAVGNQPSAVSLNREAKGNGRRLSA